MKQNTIIIKKCEGLGLKEYNDSKPFIKYSNYMDDIYGNIEEYNQDKEIKTLVAFEDMITDMLSNKILMQ